MIIKIYTKAEEAVGHAIAVKGKDEAYLQLATIYVAEGKIKLQSTILQN